MFEITRFGSFAADVSRRCHTTAAGSDAFALSVTKSRPVVVAAHIVPVFWGARASQATAPPARSAPNVTEGSTVFGAVRSRAPAGPIRTKSPQVGSDADVVNSEQLASR